MKSNLTSESNLLELKSEVKVLYARLPCNPIFPIGPIYLADYVHKCFPNIDKLIVDLDSGDYYIRVQTKRVFPHNCGCCI